MLYIINLFGGPGSGKSTTAASLFGAMKSLKKQKESFLDQYQIELVTEFAKDKVYDFHHICLENQFFTSGNQYHRMWRVINFWNYHNYKNGIIITDSPIINGIFYDTHPKKELLKKVLIEYSEFDEYKNNFAGLEQFNYLLIRDHDFEQSGRLQTSEESDKITNDIKKFFNKNNKDLLEIQTSKAQEFILNDILKNIKKEKT